MTYTRDEIMAMTAEQLRVAIAEKGGWKQDEFDPSVWRNESGEIELWYSIPDYPHDIAAAWELEESVHKIGRYQYSLALSEVIHRQTGYFPSLFTLAHATAEQKSRAWLIWSEESGEWGMLIIKIQNDSTGTVEVGNYRYQVMVNDTVIESGEIKKHKRKEGWRGLLLNLVDTSSKKELENLIGLCEEAKQ